MTSKFLVMGLAAGYHFDNVRPFIVSLKRSGYQGKCVLFVTSTTRETERMEAHGITVVPFERQSEFEHVPYNAWRYFLYLDYLKSFKYHDRVLLTDVRDVIFQSNPFEFGWDDGVNVTLEHHEASIGRCEHMTRWIRGHLGSEVWESLKNERVSCSGTTIAGHDAMVDYLERLTRLLLPFTPGERMAGYDQGVHNYLIHKNLLPQVALHDNSGPILTLAVRPGPVELDNQGCVLSDARNPAVIVHQYDRKPDLFTHFREKFSL